MKLAEAPGTAPRSNQARKALLRASNTRILGALLALLLTLSAFSINSLDGLELKQNYPNPFSNTTDIRYAVPSAGHVLLRIYNTLGQEVQVLVDESKQSGGSFSARFDGSSFPSGQYTYSLVFTAEDGEVGKLTRKMYLVR